MLWSPSHGRQLFQNCCLVGHLSTGYRLLRTGCSSLEARAVSLSLEAGALLLYLGLPLDHSLLWHPPLSSISNSPTGCEWISASPVNFMHCRGTAASPWSSPRPGEESQLWCLEHLLPLSFQWPWCRHVFAHMPSLPPPFWLEEKLLLVVPLSTTPTNSRIPAGSCSTEKLISSRLHARELPILFLCWPGSPDIIVWAVAAAGAV